MDRPGIDDLLSHAPFLERLARSLLADEEAARDLVQDTWLAALREPPRRADNLKGWFGTVMRRLARRELRAEQPIRVAELEVRADEIQNVGRARLVVSAAVLGLDEPYRQTVLQRFFEGLPPRAIASQNGLSTNTVNSRLQRALAQLRGRLDEEVGDRATWVRGLALGLGVPIGDDPTRATRLELAPRALVVSIGALSLFALILTVPWTGSTRRGEDARPVAVLTPAHWSDADDAARDSAGKRVDRSVIEPRPSAAPVGTASDGPRLIVEVVDPSGRPVADAGVFRHRRRSTPQWTPLGRTDATGRLAVDDAQALAPASASEGLAGYVGLYAIIEDWTPSPLTHIAADRRSARLTLGPRGGTVAARVVDTSGRPIVGALVDIEQPSTIQRRGDVYVQDFGRTGVIGEDGTEIITSVPAGVLRVLASAPGYVARSDSVIVAPGERSAVEFVLSAGAVLRGTVTDAGGEPVPGARVWVEQHASPRSADPAYTDAEGRFELTEVGPQERYVWARDERNRSHIASTRIEPGASTEVEWNPVLIEREPVALQIVDPDGAPLDGWTVHVRAVSDEWNRLRSTAADGTLFVYDRPDEPLEAFVYGRPHEFHGGTLPYEVVPRIEPSAEPVRVVVDPTPPSARFSGTIVDADGEPFAGLLLVELESAALQAETKIDPRYGDVETAGQPAGTYRLFAMRPDVGGFELGTHTLATGEVQDLGRVTAPALARLVIDWPNPAPGETVNVFQILGTRPLHVHRLDEPPTEPVEFLPGRYQVALWRDGVPISSSNFTFEPDTEMTIPVARLWKSRPGQPRARTTRNLGD